MLVTSLPLTLAGAQVWAIFLFNRISSYWQHNPEAGPDCGNQEGEASRVTGVWNGQVLLCV